jgi:tetratricopeptide (TPR) repeat protein
LKDDASFGFLTSLKLAALSVRVIRVDQLFDGQGVVARMSVVKKATSLALGFSLLLIGCQANSPKPDSPASSPSFRADPSSLSSTLPGSARRLYRRGSASAVPVPRRLARSTEASVEDFVYKETAAKKQTRKTSPGSKGASPRGKSSNLPRENFNTLLKKESSVPFYEIYVKGRSAYRSEQYELAIRLFTRTLRKNGRLEDAYYYRCLSRARLGRDEEAARDYKRATALHKKYVEFLEYPNIYYDRALKKIRDGQGARHVLTDWQRAIKINAAYGDRHEVGVELTDRAVKAIKLGQDAKAWEDFVVLKKVLIKDDPSLKFAKLYHVRGLNKFDKNELDGAVSDFNYSLRASSNFAPAQRCLRQATNQLEKKKRDPNSKYRIESDLRDLINVDVTGKTYSKYLARLITIRQSLGAAPAKKSKERDRGEKLTNNKKLSATAISLMKKISEKLEVSVFEFGMNLARKDQTRRDIDSAWKRSVALEKIATGARVEVVTKFKKSIAKKYSFVLVAQAQTFPEDEIEEARKMMRQALKLDRKNREARRWLRAHPSTNGAAAEPGGADLAMDEGSQLSSDLWILLIFISVLSGIAYLFFFSPKFKKTPPKVLIKATPDEAED